MTAAGCLPVCYHQGKLLFLFGLESPAEVSAKGWSDFAGGLDSNERSGNEKDIYSAALREMSEETSGFLGGPKQIDQLVKRNGGFCKYIFEFPDEEKGRKKIKKTYHIHIFRLDYDEKLIEYYNNCHQFLYEKLNHKLLASTKVFEKINIRWFTLEEMEQRRSSFRSFYRDIVDELIFEGNEIEKFVKSTIRNKK